MSEQTPLLQNAIHSSCKGQLQKTACCSFKVDLGQAAAPKKRSRCNELPIDRDDDFCYLSEQKWKYKLIALACALFLAVGSHFAAHTLGAMKNTIKKEFDITNSQYGVIQSSVAIVNTVLPVIGGIFIDAFGTIPGALITTLLITSGNILVAISASSKSLYIMIFGRILYGIGSGTVVIVQETILSQWFRGRSLAAVIALMLTVSRLASFCAQATVVPIANWTGWYGYGLWFSALLCVFSMVITLIYIALLKAVSKNTVQCRKQTEVIKRKKSFSWHKLMYLPHSFWLIASMEFLLGGGWGCFLHINSEYVKFKFSYNDSKAAATASVAQILPVVLMPFLGVFVDRHGKRTWLMIGSGLSMLFSMILLEFTQVLPIFGMLLFSISLSLGPVALVSSVPLILPLSLVGTGMGLIKSGTNIGAALFDIATGLLQDADPHKGYDGVIVFFIMVSCVAIFSGVVLNILDYSIYNGILDAGGRKKIRPCESKLNNRVSLNPLKANYFYGSIYFLLACTSWIMFFRFIMA
ncbi:major facilitator superfamily domain-containing protein [Mucor mucedo]|uniref:major facilitator superfamily domain-containing protein n=1 Tax=Mucor mucedo TaxID=29922 RepID=UPI0022207C8D|nr:major facilitator superfamily domain-containing protein [Mucor mucedo]KAI7893521.1 major facilitator superfamily domain-containing protein [Mucor mucedo]